MINWSKENKKIKRQGILIFSFSYFSFLCVQKRRENSNFIMPCKIGQENIRGHEGPIGSEDSSFAKFCGGCSKWPKS